MLKKYFISMIVITIIFAQITTSLAAGDYDYVLLEAQGSEEPVVVQPPPDGSEGYFERPPGMFEEEESGITIKVPTKLTGIVFEDFERIENIKKEGLAGTKYLTNNYDKDSDEPVVKGVDVLNEGKILATTDTNGKYLIAESGEYNLGFKFGEKITNDYQINKNTLKYNGQDYSMMFAGDSISGLELSYLRKIKEIDQSFTEVYIVIDYSVTMRESLNGEEPRINIVKESAKNFVNEIFENAESNLAVGFIAFAYEAVVLKTPTTLKDEIIDAINKFEVINGKGMYTGVEVPYFSNLNHRSGTNIDEAIDTTKSNFISENSNKVMVLFSDGSATAHDYVDPIYRDDTDEEIADKLDKIAILTNQSLKSLSENNIHLISILNETKGIEKEYVDKTFKDQDGKWIGHCYEVDYSNKEAVENALIYDVKNEVEKISSEYLKYEEEKEFSGDDDSDRRKQVNQNYDQFYYENLKLFDLIEKLDGTMVNDNLVVEEYFEQENKFSNSYENFINGDEVKKFITNSWMQTKNTPVKIYEINRTNTGKVQTITCGNKVEYTFVYEIRDGVEYCKVNGKEYLASDVFIIETTAELNGVLIRRDDNKIELEQKITGVRLTLSDGTVLYNEVSEEASNTVKQNKKLKELYCQQLQKEAGLRKEIDIGINNLDIDDVTITVPEAVTLICDTVLLQGAVLEVEYTIIIKNNSGNATFNNSISIVDYIGSQLVYRDDAELITEPGKNSDYYWRMVTCEDLYDTDLNIVKGQYISKQNKENNKKMYCLLATYNQEGYEEIEQIPTYGNAASYETRSKYINPVIGNNGERYVKVVLSKVLSPEILEDFYNKNQAEIVEYSNNNFRRTSWLEIDSVNGTVEQCYAIPGNYVPIDFKNNLFANGLNADEIDTDIANPISIIPPTGEHDVFNKDSYKRIKIFNTSMMLYQHFINKNAYNPKN